MIISTEQIHQELTNLATQINNECNNRGLLYSSLPAHEIATKCPALLQDLVLDYYRSTNMSRKITKDTVECIKKECAYVKDSISNMRVKHRNIESDFAKIDKLQNDLIDTICSHRQEKITGCLLRLIEKIAK